MIILSQYHFAMLMRGGSKRDLWALAGRTFGHPRFPDGDSVFVSPPVRFDEDSLVVETASGSLYKLTQPSGDVVAIHREIKAVVERGDYQRF